MKKLLVRFADATGAIVARVYLHAESATVLVDFVNAIEHESPRDTRFDDAAYLAARFVVFYRRRAKSLDFHGIGLVPSDDYIRENGDAITVHCVGSQKERPQFSVEPWHPTCPKCRHDHTGRVAAPRAYQCRTCGAVFRMSEPTGAKRPEALPGSCNTRAIAPPDGGVGDHEKIQAPK